MSFDCSTAQPLKDRHASGHNISRTNRVHPPLTCHPERSSFPGSPATGPRRWGELGPRRAIARWGKRSEGPASVFRSSQGTTSGPALSLPKSAAKKPQEIWALAPAEILEPIPFSPSPPEPESLSHSAHRPCSPASPHAKRSRVSARKARIRLLQSTAEDPHTPLQPC